jgi:hypothetical protein
MYSYWDADLQLEDTVLPAGTVLFHISVEEKLTAFAPCVTCFSLERPVLTGHCYIAICREDTPAQVDDLEVRIDLATAPVDIYYAGRWKNDYRRVCVDHAGRVVYVPRRAFFAPVFREIARKAQEAERQANWRYYTGYYKWVSREEAYK